MTNIRLIARLDVKAPSLIKGVHFEGLRKLGNPQEFAERYYNEGIDEILYIDAVASLYQRNTIVDLVRKTAGNVFIPICVGGGIRSVDDARALLRSGADKVAVNSAALSRPELINEISETFGSQCMVISIQGKLQGDIWEAYCDQGRERSGRDAVDWAREATARGAGEVLLTSVDQEGTCRGFDVALTRAVVDAVGVPVIASGGMGAVSHMTAAIHAGGAHAIAMAHVLHYKKLSVAEVRASAAAAGIDMRTTA